MTDKQEEAIVANEIIAALAKALPEVEGASKDKTNPHFKAKYADLSSVIEAIRPVATHGLWFRQAPVEHEKGACIETFYVHSSGQEMSAGRCYVPASKNDAQGFGSAMTYCRRYGLLAAFGIAPEDDDGNAAAKAPKDEPKPATIDASQISDLQGMIEGYGLNLVKVLQHYKIKKLTEIPADEFANVSAQINRWHFVAVAKRETAKGAVE
jgi:hypothetical protein